MKHALLSASGSHKWLECTPSARLEETLPETTSSYAEEGTLAHQVTELYNDYTFKKTIKSKRTLNKKIMPLRDNELFNEEMIGYAEGFAAYIKEKFNEVLAVDPDAYICFEELLDYSKYVPEGFGTGDVVIVSDAKLIIIDYKYGKGVRVFAKENTQMMLYALGAYQNFSYAYELKTVEAAIYQPRLDHISSMLMDVETLIAWADSTLREKAALAFDGAGDFYPGDHCRFCKYKNVCRALAEENLRLQEYEYRRGNALTNEEISDIIKISTRLANWAKDVKAYALEKALEGEIFTGWKVVEGKSNRKYANEDAIEKALKENDYKPKDYTIQSLITLTAMEKLLTKKGFNEILGAHIEKPEGKPTLVLETDKRPALNTATTDFEGVDTENL